MHIRSFIKVFCLLLSLVSVEKLVAQNLTGTDFWFPFPENTSFSNNNSSAKNEIFIVSQYCIDSAYIDVPAYNQRIYFSVEPGNFNKIDVPFEQNGIRSYVAVSDFPNELNTIVNKGIHVVSPLPISVYYLNSAPAVSDGESILPSSYLGTQYVLSMRNNGLSNCNSNNPPDAMYGYVTGTEDNTDVVIQTWNFAGPVTYNVTLDAGDVYSFSVRNDCAADYPGTQITCFGLTGTVVSSNKKVQVMAGAPCATIGVAGNCDMLMSTFLPISQQTDKYIVAQTQYRDQKVASSTIGNNTCFNDDLKGSGDYVEITGRIGDQVQITSRLGVEIATIPPPAGTTTNYGYGSFLKEMPEALPNDFGEANMMIESLNGPIQINQYNKGRHADDIDIDGFDPADPEALLVLPSTMWESSYFFYPIRSSSAETQELLLVFEDLGTPSPATTFEINDQVISDPVFSIPNTNYKFIRKSFPDFEASKVVNISGAKFGLYFFARGTRETAFFSGGYGPIQDLNLCDQCGAIDILLSGSTCFGDSVGFEPRVYSFTRPKTLNFLWNFGDGTTSTKEFPKKKYAQTGEYKVTLQVSGTGGCLLQSEKTVYINKVELSPEADPDTVCLGSSTVLKPNFDLIPGGNQVVQYKNQETAPVPIPDGGVTTFWDGTANFSQFASSFVQVDGIYLNPGRIDSICINLDHDLITDVNLYLLSPSGVIYRLLQNPQSNGRTNLRKTCFTATATQNITTAFPPYTGSYLTESGAYPAPMTTPAINGLWELRVGDERSSFTGELVDWSLYISSDIGVNEFLWSPDINAADVNLQTGEVEIFPDTTGTYYVQVSDYAGCSNNDSVDVRVERLPVELSAKDTLLCNIYTDFDLFSTITDTLLQGSGTWSILNANPGLLTDNLFNTDGLPAGDYRFKYREAIFCGFDSAFVTVSINELPFLGTSAIDTLCDTQDSLDISTYLGAGVTKNGIWTSLPVLPTNTFNDGGLDPEKTPENNYSFYYKVPVEACPLDSTVVNLQIHHQPNAGNDADTLICESGIPLTLRTVLDNNPEAGGVWTDLDNSGGLDNGLFRGINTPLNPNSSIFRFRYLIKAKKACKDSSAIATVNVSAAPEITLSADFPILCKDSTVNITATLEGNGPFDLEISDGVNTYPDASALPVGNSITFGTPLGEETTYSVTRLIDNTALKCALIKPTSITVEVYEPILAKLTAENCLLNPDGITFKGFIPVIELSGGDGTNYRYDLFIDGVLVKSDAPAPSAVHNLDTLPNGVEYSYKFYDGSNCPDLEAFFIRKPRKYCECETFVGFMDITPLEFCEYETAVAPLVTNSFLEPEDTVYYILHDKAGIVLGNRLDSNAVPSFNYRPGLEYEKRYYISAIAGDSLLGGIDPKDTCVSASDGTPIVFHQLPDVSFKSLGGAICEGDIFNLEFNMVGKGPFRLIGEKVTASGTTPIQYTFLPDSGIIPLNPLENTVYRFTSVSDGNTAACSKALNIEVNVDVFDLPRIGFDHGPEVAICDGSNIDLKVKINGGTGPYRIEFLKNGATLGAPVITSSNLYNLNVSEAGLYQINSIQDQGANCRGLVVSGSVRVVVKKQPIANAGASPIEVCGNVAELQASPTFGVGKWQQPGSGYTFSNPNSAKTFGLVPNNGSYTFIWEEENAPCPISRDTVFASFFPQPFANAGKDSLFCGTEATLYAKPSVPAGVGSGFWIYEGPGNVFFQHSQSPNSVVTVGSSGSYDLVWREDVGGTCVDFDTVNVVFSDFLRAAVIDTICLDNGNKYQFVINIVGGDPNSLTVNGNLIDKLPYITPALNSGQAYKFGFSDLSTCGYSDTLRTSYACPCISDAGEIQNSDTLKACIGDRLLVQHKTDFLKDSDDTLLYILHTRGDDTLGNILASSGTNGLFTGNLSITPGKVYYLSRVVGSKSANNLGINTNDFCISVSRGVPVVFGKKAQAIISVSNQVCEGEDLKFTFNGGGVGPYTFKLRDTPTGVGTQYSVASGDEITISYPVGTYTFYIADFKDLGNHCTALLNNRLDAVVKALPTANIVFPNTVCRFSDVLFKAQETNARVSWDFGDGSPVVEGAEKGHTFTAAGNYTVTTTLVDKVTGCIREYQNFITVQDIPDATLLINGSTDFNQVLCEDDNAFVAANIIAPGVTYRWFVNGVERTPFVPAFVLNLNGGTKKVKLTAVTSAGCYAEFSQTIKVAVPNASVKVPTEVCNRDQITISYNNANGDVDAFEWVVLGNGVTSYQTNPATFKVDEPASTNILTVNLVLTSKEGCEKTITRNVEVKQVLADFFAPGEVCLGDTVEIVNNTVNTKRLRYNFGDNSSSTSQQQVVKKLYSKPGTYTITQFVENDDEGCSDMVEKDVTILPLPKAVGGEFDVCVNTLSLLSAKGGVAYTWVPANRLETSFGSEVVFSGFTDSIPQQFIYKVGVSDLKGCVDTAVVKANIVGLDTSFVLPFFIDTLLTIGDSFTLNLPDITGLNYMWSSEEKVDCPTCPSQVFYGVSEQEYKVMVSDIFGCTDREISVLLRVDRNKRSLDMPAAFSPNGDGINDEIFPQGWGVEEYEEFRIYNRFGELVFSGSGKNPSWDGTYKGKPAPVDFYVYVVKAKIYDSRVREIIHGKFELMR